MVILALQFSNNKIVCNAEYKTTQLSPIIEHLQ